ncbi:hypothetical protein KAK07_04530 [Ideonella sp. 4Y16]|uniref:hypothetical protein n=1 Tax=Ideonella alba TaxID=2824118 RepID=UPI001B375B37|nr:hypothetical protein [Ideonella alba]MBQ0942592.1 hypothetical protein [Ideonella alba]
MRHHPLLSALLLSLSLPALAGRPATTEDAGTISPGVCELESYLGHGREDGTPSVGVQSLQLGCGATEHTQLALLGQRAHSAGSSVRSLTLAGKSRLIDGGDDGASIALAYGLGATDDGAGLRSDQSYVNGVVSWPMAPGFVLHGNLGWTRSRQAHASTTSWALAVEHAASGQWDLMGELFDNDRTRRPWIQAGVRWNPLPNRLWLDASWGWQTGHPRARAMTLGLRFAF